VLNQKLPGYSDGKMGDRIDILLITLKLLGTVFSGVFGILGLATDYRNRRTKAVTKWGRLSLLGIVVSTIVAFASQAIETVRDRITANEAKAKLSQQLSLADKTLAEVERSILPLRNLTINYSVEVPIDNPEFAAYGKKLKTGFEQMQKANAAERSAWGWEVAGGPHERDFQLGPKLLPTEKDGTIYGFLKYHQIVVSLFRQPFDISRFLQPKYFERQRPDLGFSIYPRAIKMIYALPSGKLYFWVFDTGVDQSRWEGNNRIASILDLSESLLLAQVLGPDMGGGPDGPDPEPLLASFHVVSMSIRTGDRRIFLSNFNYRERYSATLLPKLDPD
jgi:hypothetical protein